MLAPFPSVGSVPPVIENPGSNTGTWRGGSSVKPIFCNFFSEKFHKIKNNLGPWWGEFGGSGYGQWGQHWEKLECLCPLLKIRGYIPNYMFNWNIRIVLWQKIWKNHQNSPNESHTSKWREHTLCIHFSLKGAEYDFVSLKSWYLPVSSPNPTIS